MGSLCLLQVVLEVTKWARLLLNALEAHEISLEYNCDQSYTSTSPLGFALTTREDTALAVRRLHISYKKAMSKLIQGKQI